MGRCLSVDYTEVFVKLSLVTISPKSDLCVLPTVCVQKLEMRRGLVGERSQNIVTKGLVSLGTRFSLIALRVKGNVL